jgi:hypothetical protein
MEIVWRARVGWRAIFLLAGEPFPKSGVAATMEIARVLRRP